MQLSKFTDYGLRILMYLALAGSERVSAAKIARVFDISEHHVAKAASALANGGFIASGRGRAGGLALALPPEQISVGTVVRHLSGKVPVVECFDPTRNRCLVMPACGLRNPLAEAQEAFFAALDKYTLNDIVLQRGALQRLLAT